MQVDTKSRLTLPFENIDISVVASGEARENGCPQVAFKLAKPNSRQVGLSHTYH